MSQEENQTPVEAPKEETPKMEVTPEQFAELQQLEKNRAIENKRKSEENDSLKNRLAEFEKKEAEILEKDKLKKGKFEEVIAEKDELITSLTEKATAYDAYLETKEKETKLALDNLTSTISPEVMKENEFILEALSDDKKVKFLEKLTNNKPQTFDPKTKEGERIDANSEYEKAKQSGDVMAMLKAQRK